VIPAINMLVLPHITIVSLHENTALSSIQLQEVCLKYVFVLVSFPPNSKGKNNSNEVETDCL